MEIDCVPDLELNRDFDRNDIIVGQGVRRLVNNVLQDGITPDASTPDAKLNRDLNGRWADEAEDELLWDRQGEEDFHGLECDALHAIIVNGDVLGVPRKTGEIEMRKAHRLRTPLRTRRNIVHGVELDNDSRRRLRYWFCPRMSTRSPRCPWSRRMESIATRDEEGFRQVFHPYFRRRLSQTRGVSALAPLCNVAGMHDDLQFSAPVKARSPPASPSSARCK